jgi:hypothetical protein
MVVVVMLLDFQSYLMDPFYLLVSIFNSLGTSSFRIDIRRRVFCFKQAEGSVQIFLGQTPSLLTPIAV